MRSSFIVIDDDDKACVCEDMFGNKIYLNKASNNNNEYIMYA